jgi:hypothetical protein
MVTSQPALNPATFAIRRDDVALVSIDDETLPVISQSTVVPIPAVLLIRFIQNCMSSSLEDVRRVLRVDAIGRRTALRL